MYLNKLAEEIYQDNKAKGFWDEKRNIGELLMLVNSELVEALEADREEKYTSETDKAFQLQYGDNLHFQATIKNTFEDEIADAIIRLLDLCGGLGIDIDFHITEKLKYNKTRKRKHGKKY